MKPATAKMQLNRAYSLRSNKQPLLHNSKCLKSAISRICIRDCKISVMMSNSGSSSHKAITILKDKNKILKFQLPHHHKGGILLASGPMTLRSCTVSSLRSLSWRWQAAIAVLLQMKAVKVQLALLRCSNSCNQSSLIFRSSEA